MAPDWHPQRHELHGITVVVDTHGDEVFVGRCDDIVEDRVILLDADMHKDGDDGRSKTDYVERAAQYGIWKKFDRLEVPQDKVASIRRLGEL
jgi:hypothetical protein